MPEGAVTMNIEGAWKVEMLGPYGWEKVSTAFLQGGRYLAAGADHHSVGSYEDADDTLKVNVRVMQHGESRTIFGETKPMMDLRMVGEIGQGDSVLGKVYPSDNDEFDVRFRMTRLGDID
jgi:hypothetical protein